jgi:hypothetical protein
LSRNPQLRQLVRTVWASLPSDVRRTLRGVVVSSGNFGVSKRGRCLGKCLPDGSMVALDRRFLDEGEEADHEHVLAHELGHAYRARIGIAAEDYDAEEAATKILVEKIWGFRPRGQKRWQP